MTAKPLACRRAFGLIEALISAVVFMAIALAAAAFKCNAVIDGRNAYCRTAAARAALLLTETWRAAAYPETFDPTTLNDPPGLLVRPAQKGSSVPDAFIPLGTYAIVAEDVNCLATLSWDYDPDTLPLRTLNVAITWRPQRAVSPLCDVTDKVFRLTTYTEH
ncbi:MAG TPA: hypothetical protein VJJ98_07645 [Sedimentisphaerales bacterium]|nr:hypothetical protein [Sedimentisphaerales bacterium]